ncbi:hypothetical protein KM043_016690 [Ampulex compressa]|nr:hypothetical protein KM043_016690 [Ampulex compressa]
MSSPPRRRSGATASRRRTLVSKSPEERVHRAAPKHGRTHEALVRVRNGVRHIAGTRSTAVRGSASAAGRTFGQTAKRHEQLVIEIVFLSVPRYREPRENAAEHGKIVVATQQDSVPLIGLADRSTRSSQDKDPSKDLVPDPRDPEESERGARSLLMIYCPCVNLVTCRSRPLRTNSRRHNTPVLGKLCASKPRPCLHATRGRLNKSPWLVKTAQCNPFNPALPPPTKVPAPGAPTLPLSLVHKKG